MTNVYAGSSELPITPTRKLRAAEKAVFDRIWVNFGHLTASDADLLTSYAEAVNRYEQAQKETRKRPTIAQPVINRSSGNVVGEKLVRNPAFATLRESHAQIVSLGRRLLIDAASAEKRRKLATQKAISLAALEQGADDAQSFDEAEIEGMMAELTEQGYTISGDSLRRHAIWHLEILRDIESWEVDPSLLPDPEEEEERKHD